MHDIEGEDLSSRSILLQKCGAPLHAFIVLKCLKIKHIAYLQYIIIIIMGVEGHPDLANSLIFKLGWRDTPIWPNARGGHPNLTGAIPKIIPPPALTW